MILTEQNKKAVNIITAMYMGFELTVKDNLFLKFGEDGYVYQKSYIESIQEWIWTPCAISCDLKFFQDVARNIEDVQYQQILNFIQEESYIIQ